jgi:murein DD-endopeptidase MepM/ murein hydrolase activator NlpD
MINPTGREIRFDSKGSGAFGASRGSRMHKGTDYLCSPGQDVYSPISGHVMRVAYPYADDPNYSGILIQSENIGIKMFYFEPFLHLVKQRVNAGDVIGVAQDISKKYGGDMKPHIHLECVNINPAELIRLGSIF